MATASGQGVAGARGARIHSTDRRGLGLIERWVLVAQSGGCCFSEAGSARSVMPSRLASISGVRRITHTGWPRHCTVFTSPGATLAGSMITAAPCALRLGPLAGREAGHEGHRHASRGRHTHGAGGQQPGAALCIHSVLGRQGQCMGVGHSFPYEPCDGVAGAPAKWSSSCNSYQPVTMDLVSTSGVWPVVAR